MKKYYMGAMAIVLAVILAAFTNRNQNPQWEYVGGPGDEDDPTMYLLYNGASPRFTCGEDDDIICRITAPSDGGNPAHPDFEALGTGQNPLNNPDLFSVTKRDVDDPK